MTAQSDMQVDTALARLGAELAARGYEAAIRTPPGRLAHLVVTNPQATALTERVYVENETYYWSWAEPITACSDVGTAADVLVWVLRARVD